MKLIRFEQIICLLGAAIVTACSTNPSIPAGRSIQEFARELDNKRFELELTGRVWVPGMSGEPVSAQRIPRGLLLALGPAVDHCTRAGGEITYPKLQAAGGSQLPLRALCQRGTDPIWAVDLQYLGVATKAGEDSMGRKTLQFLTMTTRTEYLSSESLVMRVRDEQAQAQAREQAAAAQRERDAANEQERLRLARARDAEAQRAAAMWPARVAEFRANMKAGDRFKWSSPPGGISGGPIVGMVIRTEGSMAYVQFDNLIVAGQQTRYLKKEEIEPFDGPTPGARYEIK